MTKKHADDQQPDGCPRRAETGSTLYLPDTWHERDGWHRCSYCGSMRPDDFMAVARAGVAELGPTDKNYKVYVETAGGSHGKFYFQHLSEEQRKEFVDLYNARPRRTYSDTGMTYAVADRDHARTGMAVGYPGSFYVLPFFMARGGHRG